MWVEPPGSKFLRDLGQGRARMAIRGPQGGVLVFSVVYTANTYVRAHTRGVNM